MAARRTVDIEMEREFLSRQLAEAGTVWKPIIEAGWSVPANRLREMEAEAAQRETDRRKGIARRLRALRKLERARQLRAERKLVAKEEARS